MNTEGFLMGITFVKTITNVIRRVTSFLYFSFAGLKPVD
jgi:hypothetical protein